MNESRPFMQIRPKLYLDGNQWCALYGEDFQSGVAGFGDSPEQAAYAFDKAWCESLHPKPQALPTLPHRHSGVWLINPDGTYNLRTTFNWGYQRVVKLHLTENARLEATAMLMFFGVKVSNVIESENA